MQNVYVWFVLRCRWSYSRFVDSVDLKKLFRFLCRRIAKRRLGIIASYEVKLNGSLEVLLMN